MDIVFPIRKTLTNFMAIKIFNPAVIGNNNKKKYFINSVVDSVKNRFSFIIHFIYFLKYKLFINLVNLHYTVYNHMNYYRYFSLINILISLNYYKSIANYTYQYSISKTCIFRRFFSISYKKKVLNFLNNKLTIEAIEANRRANRKPLTLVQKVKYNEKRRLKRLEKALQFDVDQHQLMFDAFKSNRTNRSFRYRKFRDLLKSSLRYKGYCTNNNNNNIIICSLRIYIYIFFIKFFKFIIFNYYSSSNRKNIKRKSFMKLRRSKFFKIVKIFFFFSLNNNL
jgi:hypothetical protein